MRWTRSLFSRSTTVHFGLDISSTAVKLIELQWVDSQYRIQTMGRQELPEALILGNRIQDISELARHIQDLLSKLHLWQRSDRQLQAIIAVPDACTIHKRVQISERLTEDDLEELVSLELSKCLPDTAEDIYYDFQSIGVAPQSGLKTVLIIAAYAHYITDRVAALRQLNIPVALVDTDSLAIQRTLPFLLSDPMQSSITVVLDLNTPSLKVLFFKQTNLLFIHEEEFDLAIQSLRSRDLVYRDYVWQKFKRACHFFHADYPFDHKIAQMLVSGEGAQCQQLIVWLQEQCDYPVDQANPFKHMSIAAAYEHQQLAQDAPLYLTALGLAKRVCSGHG